MPDLNRLRNQEVFWFGILFSIGLFPILIGPDLTTRYGHIFFFSQLAIIFWRISRRRDTLAYLTPGILTISYVGLCLGIGSLAFSNDMYLRAPFNYEDYGYWYFADFSASYFLLAISLIFLAEQSSRRKLLLPTGRATDVRRRPIAIYGTVSVAIATPFLFFPLDLAFVGGQGDLSIVPKTLAALAVFYFLAVKGAPLRFLGYMAVLALFAIDSVFDKRDAIFLLLPIFLLEAALNFRRLTLRLTSLLALTMVFSILLVMLMSIARGYGELQHSNRLIDAVPFLATYFKLEDFASMLLNNLEINYVYYHSMQSLEYVQKDTSLLAWGSTLIKPLFIPIPRELIDFKPESMIHLYTTHHSPAYRVLGGSWAVNSLAELFWNFHFGALIAVYFIYRLFYSLFCRLINIVLSGSLLVHFYAIFAYMQILTYIRGGGLDIYAVMVGIAVIFCLITKSTASILRENMELALRPLPTRDRS